MRKLVSITMTFVMAFAPLHVFATENHHNHEQHHPQHEDFWHKLKDLFNSQTISVEETHSVTEEQQQTKTEDKEQPIQEEENKTTQDEKTEPNQPNDSSNPYQATTGLYVETNTPVTDWVKSNSGSEVAKLIQEKIASKPAARWFGGENVGGVADYVKVAAEQQKLPVLVAYHIPNRDCGQHSKGGAGDAEGYKDFIRKFSAGIGKNPAVVILEPDALGQMDCLSAADQQLRTDLLKDATEVFKKENPQTFVYIDAGNSGWTAPEKIADYLQKSGIANARGFATNVSNYYTAEQEKAYGQKIVEELETKHKIDAKAVIDTSRNGNGSNGEWCNPPGRKIGETPTTKADGFVDALLWIKPPGGSDGDCGIAKGTYAGQFVPGLAVSLIQGK